jgi:multimeric flavodoxin WrbA
MAGKLEKYILAVVGSPRKQGNSDLLCDRVLDGANSAGARVEKVFLHDRDIRPCNGCEACLKGKLHHCVIDDDMGPLYPKLQECDVLVIASPIYFLNLTAQTILFLNRTYPLFNPDECAFGAKQVVACLTYGDTDPIGSGCDIAAHILRDLFRYAKIPMTLIHASALKRGEIKANKGILEKAYQLGKTVIT